MRSRHRRTRYDSARPHRYEGRPRAPPKRRPSERKQLGDVGGTVIEQNGDGLLGESYMPTIHKKRGLNMFESSYQKYLVQGGFTINIFNLPEKT